jgi:hypothetical protein
MITTYYPLKLTDQLMNACLAAFYNGEAHSLRQLMTA